MATTLDPLGSEPPPLAFTSNHNTPSSLKTLLARVRLMPITFGMTMLRTLLLGRLVNFDELQTQCSMETRVGQHRGASLVYPAAFRLTLFRSLSSSLGCSVP
jgi:hypothetical protein